VLASKGFHEYLHFQTVKWSDAVVQVQNEQPHIILLFGRTNLAGWNFSVISA
jgi:hypothetical protein